jgi:hypothetical protein
VVYTGTEKWDSTAITLTARFDARGAGGEVRYTTSKTFATSPNSGEGFGMYALVAAWVPDPGADSGVGGDASDSSADAGAANAVADAPADAGAPD